MLRLRRATADDSRDLWLWRNDPATMSASISSGQIPWALHSDWFERKLSERDSAIYIGDWDDRGEKVGMCRFEIQRRDQSAEVSINLNPDHRGQRRSRPLLSAAIEQFRSDFSDVAQLTAVIRESNDASKKLFTSAGFSQVSEQDGVGAYVLPLAN